MPVSSATFTLAWVSLSFYGLEIESIIRALREAKKVEIRESTV